MLTDTQRTYFDAMSEMMNTQGWQFFISDVQGNIEAIKDSLLAQSDLEKFFIVKGRYQASADILGLQGFLETTRKALEEQVEDDAL